MIISNLTLFKQKTTSKKLKSACDHLIRIHNIIEMLNGDKIILSRTRDYQALRAILKRLDTENLSATDIGSVLKLVEQGCQSKEIYTYKSPKMLYSKLAGPPDSLAFFVGVTLLITILACALSVGTFTTPELFIAPALFFAIGACTYKPRYYFQEYELAFRFAMLLENSETLTEDTAVLQSNLSTDLNGTM